MNEVWKDVVGYENFYQVSNLGRVRSLDRVDVSGHKRIGRMKKLSVDTKGYVYTKLYKDGEYTLGRIHRQVATLFLSNPDSKPEVNHIDGNPKNNRVDNLEWCTSSENKLHAFSIGLRDSSGENNSRATLTEEDVYNILHLLSEGLTGREVANRFNVRESCVSRIKTGKRWPHIAKEFLQ